MSKLFMPRNFLQFIVFSRRIPAAVIRLLFVLFCAYQAQVNLKEGFRYARDSKCWGVDLFQDYLASRAILHGIDPYTVSVEELRLLFHPAAPGPMFLHPTPHPPLFPIILSFLGPENTARFPDLVLFYYALSVVCIIVGAVLVMKASTYGGGFYSCVAGGLILLSSNSALEQMHWENLSSLIFLLFSIFYWGLQREKTGTLAGFSLGLCLALKFVGWPFLVLLLFMKRWVTLGIAITTFMVLQTLCVATIGMEGMLNSLSSLHSVSSLWARGIANLAPLTWITKAFEGVYYLGAYMNLEMCFVPGLAPGSAYSKVAVVVCALALVAFFVSVVRKCKDDQSALALATCMTIMVAPVAWKHTILILFLPALNVIEAIMDGRLPSQVSAAISLFCVVGLLYLQDWIVIFYMMNGREYWAPVSYIGFASAILMIIYVYAMTSRLALQHAPKRSMPAKMPSH